LDVIRITGVIKRAANLKQDVSGSNDFCGSGKNDSGSEDETDIPPRHAVVFPGFAGAEKSVSSSDPLLFFPGPQNPLEPGMFYNHSYNEIHETGN